MENYTLKNNLGKYKITSYKNDSIISKLLEKNIIWGENFKDIFKILIDENTNVLDIGAFIGTFSILMSEFISEKNKIIAFEPVFNELLKLNVLDNNLPVEIIDYGLSNNVFYIESFYIDFNLNCNYGSFNFKQFLKNNVIKIADNLENDKKYIKFDKLDNFNFNNISFIKIDVEYFEYEVLEGSIKTLIENNYPSILIELFIFSPIIYYDKNSIINKNKEIVEKNTLNCFSLLSSMDYICIPLIAIDGEFLFIHKSKTDKINKLLKYLSENKIKNIKYYNELLK